MFKIFSTDICRINIKWGIQRVILRPSYILDARFLKVNHRLVAAVISIQCTRSINGIRLIQPVLVCPAYFAGINSTHERQPTLPATIRQPDSGEKDRLQRHHAYHPAKLCLTATVWLPGDILKDKMLLITYRDCPVQFHPRH